MSYQALYRVWRPQTFDELVGQEMIGQTLKNAVIDQEPSHAYLFSGPRGTGKTSAAKIMAKAVNCPNNQDGNPCNECQMCELITKGQMPDVVEIDAASNNGVDEIRDLRDKVRYAASQAIYKVYIIDEVHMLTTGAFNALLKTLEEPPEGVIFILATTEAHKIPATILSRVQRFDFQRISQTDLIARMEEILNYLETPYQEEALAIIARAANGGMRDSLSLLDQALSFQSDQLTVDSALEVSGSLSQLDLIDYLQALYRQEAETALIVLNHQLQAGKQAGRFLEDLILFCRDLLLSKHTKNNYTLLTQEEIAPVLEELPSDFYYQLITELNETQSQMRFSSQPDLYLEVMTVKVAEGLSNSSALEAPASSDQLKERLAQVSQAVRSLTADKQLLEARLDQQAQQLEDLAKRGPVTEPSTQVERPSPSPAIDPADLKPRSRPTKDANLYMLDKNELFAVLNTATRSSLDQLQAQWPTILADLVPLHRAKFAGSSPVAASSEAAVISCDNEMSAGKIQVDSILRQTLQEKSYQHLGYELNYVFVSQADWLDLRQEYLDLRRANDGQPIELAQPSPASAELEPKATAEAPELEELQVTSPEDESQEAEAPSPASEPDQAATDVEEEIEIPETGPFSQGDPLPKSVSRLIEAMGADRVNIIYDNEEA